LLFLELVISMSLCHHLNIKNHSTWTLSDIMSVGQISDVTNVHPFYFAVCKPVVYTNKLSSP